MSETDSWLMKNPDLTVLFLILLNFLVSVITIFLTNIIVIDTIQHFVISFTLQALFWILIVPLILHLSNGKELYRDYFRRIKLTPISPLGKKLLYGIVGSILTLAGLFLAVLLYG